MLKLLVENQKTPSATIPVRWCIDPETLKKLEAWRVKNPRLLIVVWSVERCKEYRYLVPLKQILQYVQFRCSGENKVFATIVWDPDGKAYKLWEKYLARPYKTDVVNTGLGSMINDLDQTLGSAELTVQVAKEFFAKEPPKWEQGWVNFWFRSKPVDQCAYRRRRIIAYSLQPIVVPPYYFLKALICFITALGHVSFGRRGVNFKPIIKPWRYDIDYVWRECWKEKSVLSSLFLWQFKPGVIILVIGALVILNTFFKKLPWSGNLAVQAPMAIAAFYIVSWVCMLILMGFAWLDDKIQAAKAKEEAKAEEYRQDYGWLLCDDSFAANLEGLPKERRTVVLKYQDLKSKVCEPFAD